MTLTLTTVAVMSTSFHSLINGTVSYREIKTLSLLVCWCTRTNTNSGLSAPEIHLLSRHLHHLASYKFLLFSGWRSSGRKLHVKNLITERWVTVKCRTLNSSMEPRSISFFSDHSAIPAFPGTLTTSFLLHQKAVRAPLGLLSLTSTFHILSCIELPLQAAINW